MVVAEHFQAAGPRVFLYPYLVPGIDQETVPLRLTPRRFEGQERLRAFRVAPEILEGHHFRDFLAVTIRVPEQDSAAFARVVLRPVLTYHLNVLLADRERHAGLRIQDFRIQDPGAKDL